MTYEQIKEKVFGRVVELAGKELLGNRAVKEEFNIDSVYDFKSTFEVVAKGSEVYTVEIWGSYQSWNYSIDKLLECGEGDKL